MPFIRALQTCAYSRSICDYDVSTFAIVTIAISYVGIYIREIIMKPQHIKIFDTTLRDGQQCPGAGMAFEKNIEYARLACELKIDVLEAGFPSASSLDFEI